MYLEIYPFLLGFPVYVTIGFEASPHDPLGFIDICCNIPLSISNCINLSLFPPLSSQIG
jgi:hypothetical protein